MMSQGVRKALVTSQSFNFQEDLVMGKRLGVGGFGAVFMAELKQGKGKPTISVVAKKVSHTV